MLDAQTKQQLKDKWQQIKPVLKQKFTQLSDNDLDQTQGDADKLCSTIEQKTGQAKQMVEETLKQLVSSSS